MDKKSVRLAVFDEIAYGLVQDPGKQQHLYGYPNFPRGSTLYGIVGCSFYSTLVVGFVYGSFTGFLKGEEVAFDVSGEIWSWKNTPRSF